MSVAAMDMTLIGTAVFGAFGLVVLGAALWVRIKGTSIEELRGTIQTANQEIQILRAQADRLQASLTIDATEIATLRSRISSLETENAILRGTLASGKELAPEFTALLLSALKDHEARSGVQYRETLEEFRSSIEDSHQRFAQLLPPEVGKALRTSLGSKPKRTKKEGGQSMTIRLEGDED